MKKYLILLFLLSALSVKSQTYVSGFINANTLWTLSNSPYIVNGNVLLSNGYTLTIEPGVTIMFDSNRTLQIDGELIAIGTSTQRIIFTSMQAVQNPGDWGKIQFQDTSVDAIFDTSGNYLSGSIMKYCDVLWGGGIGFGSIQIHEAMPYFTHCNILNSSSAGIYGLGSYVIDSSAIKYNNDFGICLISACGFKVLSDTFIGNQQGGILIGQNYCSPQIPSLIKNNHFELNNGHGAIYQTGVIYDLNILENLFLDNSGTAVIGDNGQNQGLYNSLISCNQFLNNTALCFKPGSLQDVSFTQNIFNYNGRIISMSSLMGLFSFTNNIVHNCTTTQYLFDFRITTPQNQPFLLINNNEFKGNTSPVLFHLSLVASVTNSNSLIEIKHNNFLDSSLTYIIQNDIPFGSYNIAADSNYWGTTNTAFIDTVIHDYFDDGNLSVVYYPPILTLPTEIDTSCSFPISTFIEENDFFNPNLFPNPFLFSAQFEFTRNLKNATLIVYNLVGEKVRQVNNINEKSIILHRENMLAGIYIYQFIETNFKITSGKFVVLD